MEKCLPKFKQAFKAIYFCCTRFFAYVLEQLKYEYAETKIGNITVLVKELSKS
jgi:hypothetical protein